MMNNDNIIGQVNRKRVQLIQNTNLLILQRVESSWCVLHAGDIDRKFHNLFCAKMNGKMAQVQLSTYPQKYRRK